MAQPSQRPSLDLADAFACQAISSVLYNARLKLTPAAGETVVITPLNSRPDQVSLSPLSRQLDNSNWNTGRNFTITAVNDTVPEVDESGTITHNATSNQSGSVFNGAQGCTNIAVTLTDDDGATPTFTRTFTPTSTRTPTPTATSTATPAVCPLQQGEDPRSPACELEEGVGLRGAYYNGTYFNELKLTRIDSTVSFNWGNTSPHPNVQSNLFSVVWDGFIRINWPDTYTFCVESDDGFRLWVNNQLLIDDWSDHGVQTTCRPISLNPVVTNLFSIHLEYFENGGDAVIRLMWQDLNGTRIIPYNVLYPSPNQPVVWGTVPPWIIPTPVPFDTYRLREIAMNYPGVIWPNGNVPTSPESWNREVGTYFQERVLALIGVPASNNVNFSSEERFAAGGRPAVRPDGLADVSVRSEEQPGVFIDEIIPATNLIEVKAVQRNISRSYEYYQFVGLVDVARTFEFPLARRFAAGILTTITTSNTTLNPDIVALATSYNTIFCYAIVWEIRGATPFTSRLIIQDVVFVNPEVQFTIPLLSDITCPNYNGNYVLLLARSNPVLSVDDPDPAMFVHP